MDKHTKPPGAQHPLSETLSRLTLQDTAAQTPLPPSSPAQQLKSPALHSPSALWSGHVPCPSSPAQHHHHPRPSPSPLRRTASAMSVDNNNRSSSPALARRTSTASLRNGADSPVSLHSPRLLNRRSSSNLLLQQLMPALEEAPLTAERIALEHFTRELAVHGDPDAATEYKTVVVIHDDCYGHRFSRLKTKNTIDYITERPERVQAGVMGISAAYVRLGERHSGGTNAPHPKKDPSKKLPFRILKSSRKVPLHADAVTAVHGKEWMKELQGLCDTSGQRLAAASLEIARAPGTKESPKMSFHSGDLYLCEESINAFEGALGGVCDAVDAVFQGAETGKGPSQAFACVRPPGHHCSSDWPSGFCWLNNVHVGIQHAIQNYGLTHAAIIDFDLHHGDGSQEIAWGHNERMFYPEKKMHPSKKSFLGYFSLHDINSFPCEAGDREKTQMASLCIDNAHGQAIWNVHLEQWETPDQFWHLYETRYKVILEKARKFLKHRTNEMRSSTGKNNRAPRAAIFISAGFDASEHEGSGMQRHSVNVPTEFYARFTRDIVELAREEGTSVDGRVISVLEGGYSDKALISGVLSHISGLCEGSALAVEQKESNPNILEQEDVGLSGLTSATPIYSIPSEILMKYNTEWWHSMNLDTLVSLLHPPPVHKAGPKKSKVATYSSPTHASAMKIVDPNKIHRSPSMSSRAPSVAASRAASPPPPDVDWAVASSELCKLLIPQSRQISSHTQEELNPKDIKIKKERTPEVVAAIVPGARTLRERKARVSNVADIDPAIARRKASADRRQTIAHPLPSMEIDERPKEPRRRLSIASTISTTSVATIANPRPRATKPAAPGLDVKKTRPSSSATSSRASSVKPPAVQRVPSNTVRRQNSTRTSSNSIPPSREKATQNGDADLDSITSGLKRITIKVPSNEEYQARQPKGPVAAEKSAPTAGRTVAVKKPVAPRTSKATANTTAKRPAAREPAKSRLPAVAAGSVKPPPIKVEKGSPPPLQEIPHMSTSLQNGHAPGNDQRIGNPNNLPLNGNQSNGVQPGQQQSFGTSTAPQPTAPANAGVSSPTSSSAAHAPQAAYSSIQFAPPNSDISAQQASKPLSPNDYSGGLQWMPPNSDTGVASKPAEAVKPQKEIPTFSATGHIPFAPPAPTAAPAQQDGK